MKNRDQTKEGSAGQKQVLGAQDECSLHTLGGSAFSASTTGSGDCGAGEGGASSVDSASGAGEGIFSSVLIVRK